METVHSDIKNYLMKNIFPSRTVLVFPPFNGFRRFLIHKLIEDNFASSEVAAFSIGVDISRRIVVCYKGLIREGQDNVTGAELKKTGFSMIEKEKQNRQKLNPTAAVYRPPAARLADSRRTSEDTRPPDSKGRNRVRRPDLQVYVPRPKRASFGNEQPRSRSRSSSRTSLDSDSCDKRNKSSPNKSERSRFSQSNEAISDKYKTEPSSRLSNCLESTPDNIPPSCRLNISASSSTSLSNCLESIPDNIPSSGLNISASSSTRLSNCLESIPDNIQSCGLNISAISSTTDVSLAENNVELNRSSGISISSYDLIQPSQHNPVTSCDEVSKDVSTIAVSENALHKTEIQPSEQSCCALDVGECVETKSASIITKDCPRTDTDVVIKGSKSSNESDVEIDENPLRADSEVTSGMSKASGQPEDRCLKSDAMETISISSDSRDQNSNSSLTTSSNDSKSSESSSDSEVSQKRSRRRSYEPMEIEHSSKENKKETNPDRSKSQEQNLKNRRIFPSLPVSDVLIISDSSSSDEHTNIPKEHNSRVEIEERSRKPPPIVKGKIEKHVKTSKEVDPDDCDWESLYDDSGECLVPDLMEELTNSVGRVRVTSVDSDYRPYQSIEERTNDGECVIEIYDFPVEFKTTDLFNIFAAYRNKSCFQIKWVDDTHALGVFPSPLMADEVLACTLPFVKTRPLRLGIAESRNKARNLVLPPLPSIERPKTCTALARRLVSGALGLRLPTSSQEREKEKQVLKEAREKRRLEAKQREAAWDGTLTSGV